MEEDHIRKVLHENDFDQARILFLEYMDQFGLDLEYFDFDLELSTLEHIYKEPLGFILLHHEDEEDRGLVALRRFSDGVLELKRMYIQQDYITNQKADRLMIKALKLAKKMSYHQVLLDVLPEMDEHVALYERQGFYLIPPFRYDPIPRTLFMKKEL